MSVHLLVEARRCLDCRVPMCQRACPVHTPIPKIIKMMLEGNLDKAGQTLLENNPLTTICPLVCNYEKQCEGHCVLGRSSAPIHFSSIEQYISSAYASRISEKPVPLNGMRVAIIGSGPAGLTIAVILARRGYQVTIFESKEKIGGVLRYGIPDFRLPKSILDDFEQHHLRSKNIKVRPNTTIGGALTIEDLFADGYKSVFVGAGVWQPNTLRIKGETLGNVHFGINYLNNPDSYHLGETINVIGAGNAAMDVCRTALRKGVRHVNCFSLSEKVAASRQEFDYAVLEGVQFYFNKKPKEITDDGVIFEDIAEYNDGTYEIVPNSQKLYAADSTIISISQVPRAKLVRTTNGLELGENGLLPIDENYMTTRPGVFGAGDVVTGAKTVVHAVDGAKKAAEAMIRFMEGEL